MCLKDPTPITDPEERCGEGWKVFGNRGNVLHTLFWGTWRRIPVNRWVKERDWRGSMEVYGVLYGWHIFLLLGDALTYCRWVQRVWAENNLRIHRVRYRGAHSLGVQEQSLYKLAAIVAREMLVLPEAADVS